MKFFFLTLSFLTSLMVGGIFIYAVPKAEQKIESQFSALGFKDVKISKSTPTLTGLHVQNIALDKDGFNTIENFEIDIFWPTAFLKSEIKNIYINNIEMSLVPSEFKRFLNITSRLQSSDSVTFQSFIIEKITIDLALSEKALRFIGNLNITNIENNYAIKGQLNAIQHDLAFNTNWTGLIDNATQKLQLDGTVADLKVHFPPFNMSRAQGWISYASDQDKDNLALQIDAGSAKIFDLATKNLSLVVGQDDGGYPVLLRTHFAGLNDATFISDFYYAKKTQDRKFNTILDIPDHAEFIRLLKLQKIIEADLELEKFNLSALNAEMTYMPEKRFAGGPLPFDVTLNEDLSGAVLIYPDSLDVRGTINAQQSTIEYLENLFSIPEENMTENVIRLDSNLKKLKDAY